MKVHHLNVATLCPVGGFLVHGGNILDLHTEMVAHALLIESNEGLVLVDTGFGTADIENPAARFSWGFLNLLRPSFDYEETAFYQVKKLGFRPEDVRHIVVTHLDLDHAGGLPDFPWAQVHVYQPEKDAALQPNSFHDENRYCPQHFKHPVKWQAYNKCGETWHGFDSTRALNGLPDEILMIPLAGHSAGHQAIAIETENGTLLHCGDAYFFHGELDKNHYQCPLGLQLFQGLVAENNQLRETNLARLQQLASEEVPGLEIFCAHDPVELHRLQKKEQVSA